MPRIISLPFWGLTFAVFLQRKPFEDEFQARDIAPGQVQGKRTKSGKHGAYSATVTVPNIGIRVRRNLGAY